MRENLLTDLPSGSSLSETNETAFVPFAELCRLRLRILNVSSNKISLLPLDLRLMSSLVDLGIDANPLTAPPAKLCTKGRVHAFKWLDVDAAHKGRKHLEWPGQRPISIGGGTLGRSTKTYVLFFALFVSTTPRCPFHLIVCTSASLSVPPLSSANTILCFDGVVLQHRRRRLQVCAGEKGGASGAVFAV